MGYITERKNLSFISKYLERMSIPYKFEDIGDKEGQIFPAILCKYNCHDLDFDVILYNIENWINVKCKVLDIEHLSSKGLLKLYGLSLELNYDLPETTFSKYKNSLYIEIDCLNDIDYDDFNAEFYSIGNGIEIFISVLKKQHAKILIENTKVHILRDIKKH